MNYGGVYRNTPTDLVAQESAENLFLVENLVVNKEQRIPDIAYFRTTPDPASIPNHWLLHGQEFHTSYWGHLGLLNLTHNFLLTGLRCIRQHRGIEPFPHAMQSWPIWRTSSRRSSAMLIPSTSRRTRRATPLSLTENLWMRLSNFPSTRHWAK